MVTGRKISGMPHFGHQFRSAIEANHISIKEFSERSGLSIGTLYRLFGMSIPRTNPRTYRTVAEALNLTVQQLDSYWMERQKPPLKGDPHGGIPILSDIPATNGVDQQAAWDQGIGEGYISRQAVNVEDPMAYCLRVVGDSMSPTLVAGDMIVLSPAAVHEKGFEDGSIYALRLSAVMNDEATVKRVRLLSRDEIELCPDNDRHPRRRVRLTEIVNAAKAVKRLSDLF